MRMSIASKTARDPCLVFLVAAVLGAGCSTAIAAPAPPAKSQPNTVSDLVPTAQGPLRITPLFHGSVMLQLGAEVIYVDPWSAADYTGLPKADVILVTHTHADHLDLPMIRELHKPGVVIGGSDAVLDTLNCSPDCGDLAPVGVGRTTTIKGVNVEGVAMYNTVERPGGGPPYHHKGVGQGFLLTIGGVRIYFSGDSDCTDEMKALKKVDIAFVAMNPPRTMSTVEAARCVKVFRPRVVYPYHYRGSKTSDFADALKGETGIEVRLRNLEGEPSAP